MTNEYRLVNGKLFLDGKFAGTLPDKEIQRVTESQTGELARLRDERDRLRDALRAIQTAWHTGGDPSAMRLTMEEARTLLGEPKP